MADLSVERGHRCRHHDDAALTVRVRRIGLHGHRGRFGDQDRTEQIDFDHAPKGTTGHRTLPADQTSRGRNARAIDRRGDAAHLGRRLLHGAVDRRFIAHVDCKKRRAIPQCRRRSAALRDAQIEYGRFAAGVHDSSRYAESQA